MELTGSGRSGALAHPRDDSPRKTWIPLLKQDGDYGVPVCGQTPDMPGRATVFQAGKGRLRHVADFFARGGRRVSEVEFVRD